ncbi:MAG TPA: DUF4186 domain-containing protein [Pirellulales bacterium]|nr:DUF4186 domain-containing protein [Pirellulales bacterium]
MARSVTLLNDQEIYNKLSRSRFRARFRLAEREIAYLDRKGLAIVLRQARELLLQRLAPAEPANDGRQTPWRGHPVFVAQHATATCCRSCLLKWHGIAKGRELTASELDYVVGIIGGWLDRQEGPPIRPGQAQLPLFDD